MKKPIIILGGGLWGGLLAYFLFKKRPELDFILFEKDNVLGGNHTWSFHQDDVSKSAFPLLGPMIEKSWDRYEVRFPSYSRTVHHAYHCISSKKFHNVLAKDIPYKRIKLSHQLNLQEALKQSEFVIDARGLFQVDKSGYQNFFGLEIKLFAEHHLKFPVLMDATVNQLNEFRFIYTLPFDENRLLIEDTRYSDQKYFLVQDFEQEIFKICDQNNWKIEKILRKEMGSLPIPLTAPNVEETDRTISLSGIFHDTTGYSLPDAIRVIEKFIVTDFSYLTLKEELQKYRYQQESTRSFFRLLNRLIFKAALPEKRYLMLQHFYRLPDNLIGDFYAGHFGLEHKLRLFTGRPPVSLTRAVLEMIR